MPNKIKKILVANRGEIAIRILRAASELKLTTVSVYTYEDRFSPHRYKADEAYQIGVDEEALKPYLDIEELIETAKLHNVDAIHPGYGFLSENVRFARRCREEGIIFVGPAPEVMEQLGDKVQAKQNAIDAGIKEIQTDMDTLHLSGACNLMANSQQFVIKGDIYPNSGGNQSILCLFGVLRITFQLSVQGTIL